MAQSAGGAACCRRDVSAAVFSHSAASLLLTGPHTQRCIDELAKVGGQPASALWQPFRTVQSANAALSHHNAGIDIARTDLEASRVTISEQMLREILAEYCSSLSAALIAALDNFLSRVRASMSPAFRRQANCLLILTGPLTVHVKRDPRLRYWLRETKSRRVVLGSDAYSAQYARLVAATRNHHSSEPETLDSRPGLGDPCLSEVVCTGALLTSARALLRREELYPQLDKVPPLNTPIVRPSGSYFMVVPASAPQTETEILRKARTKDVLDLRKVVNEQLVGLPDDSPALYPSGMRFVGPPPFPQEGGGPGTQYDVVGIDGPPPSQRKQ